ncbi:Holliday junction resolvase MOC1, chloroplastic-like isoform X2 [Lycium barbarum]|uniref:Holliday junction resolvase MOC1, chloroplastic-like isoform X2 n=1 Tax=Lycium barbarum TaxID=112863 RepID=UPI00293EC423|nr:Holliday junction resolvase MOC1, chloroplastic-like isoform X2 [Lycium barbarum]
MESIVAQTQPLQFITPIMASKLIPTIRFTTFKLFSTSSSSAPVIITTTPVIEQNPTTTTPRNGASKGRGSKGILEAQLKMDWLESLSCPFPYTEPLNTGWVIGVDPDTSGALALLKPNQPPQEQLRTLNNQLRIHKTGWWSGGFGYGLWIGLLVASGFSVIPVPSSAWKSEFQLTRERSNKDYSREAASSLFPSLSTLLKRKKDHGRAEALLIAAYGKGIKINSEPLCSVEN